MEVEISMGEEQKTTGHTSCQEAGKSGAGEAHPEVADGK